MIYCHLFKIASKYRKSNYLKKVIQFFSSKEKLHQTFSSTFFNLLDVLFSCKLCFYVKSIKFNSHINVLLFSIFHTNNIEIKEYKNIQQTC